MPASINTSKRGNDDTLSALSARMGRHKAPPPLCRIKILSSHLPRERMIHVWSWAHGQFLLPVSCFVIAVSHGNEWGGKDFTFLFRLVPLRPCKVTRTLQSVRLHKTSVWAEFPHLDSASVFLTLPPKTSRNEAFLDFLTFKHPHSVFTFHITDMYEKKSSRLSFENSHQPLC